MSTVRKLRDLAIVAAGQGAPQGEENYCTNGIPFIKAGNLIELLNGKKERDIQNVSEEVAKQYRLKLYPAGTVLFAKSGMSCMKGYVYVLQSDCYVVSHLACIIPIETTGAYLKYYFEYHRPNSLIKDEAYPSISLSDIGNLDIRLETPVKQAAIVNNLDRINALIKCRKAQLHKIDDLVKSQFIEMFEKREFDVLFFGDLCEFLRNGANIKQSKGAGGYPITRIETLSNDVFNANRLGYADITDLDRYQGYLLHEGDILISHINSIAYLGRAVQYRGELDLPVIHGMNLLCARLKKSVLPDYIEAYFRTKKAKEYISTITKKAVNQASITITDLKKMKVPVPPIELQSEFAHFVEQTDKSKVLMEQARKLVQILIKLILNIGTIEKSIQICYNGHRKEGV